MKKRVIPGVLLLLLVSGILYGIGINERNTDPVEEEPSAVVAEQSLSIETSDDSEIVFDNSSVLTAVSSSMIEKSEETDELNDVASDSDSIADTLSEKELAASSNKNTSAAKTTDKKETTEKYSESTNTGGTKPAAQNPSAASSVPSSSTDNGNTASGTYLKPVSETNTSQNSKKENTAASASDTTPSSSEVTSSSAHDSKQDTEKNDTVTVSPSEPEVPAHNHQYSGTVTKAAICTADGVMSYTCSCGASYTEAISKTDHSWTTTETQIWIVDQTAYDEPVKSIISGYQCVDCGQKYTSAECAAGALVQHQKSTGHGQSASWNDIQITTVHHDEVGHYETVSSTRCSVCGMNK